MPLTRPATPLLVTDREAATLLSIGRATLHRLRAAGQFPPGVKLGRCLRFRLDQLQSFLDCGCDMIRWRALHEQPRRPSRVGS
jgi:predicted DNA-binding transcriptional regulator AlpA